MKSSIKTKLLKQYNSDPNMKTEELIDLTIETISFYLLNNIPVIDQVKLSNDEDNIIFIDEDGDIIGELSTNRLTGLIDILTEINDEIE